MSKPDVSILGLRGHMWTRCKTRKPHQCEVCNESIPKGEWAYRPLSESPLVARYHRLCRDCGPRVAARIFQRDPQA